MILGRGYGSSQSSPYIDKEFVEFIGNIICVTNDTIITPTFSAYKTGFLFVD